MQLSRGVLNGKALLIVARLAGRSANWNCGSEGIQELARLAFVVSVKGLAIITAG